MWSKCSGRIRRLGREGSSGAEGQGVTPRVLALKDVIGLLSSPEYKKT